MSIPNRRECITQNVQWNNNRYHITIGFCPVDNDPIEIWCYGPKIGSGEHSLLVDVCRDMSLQLQDGRDVADIVSRAHRDDNGAPMSIYGVIADELLEHSNV